MLKEMSKRNKENKPQEYVVIDNSLESFRSNKHYQSIFIKSWKGDKFDTYLTDIKPLLVGILNKRYESYKIPLINYKKEVLSNLECLNSESNDSTSKIYKQIIKDLVNE